MAPRHLANEISQRRGRGSHDGDRTPSRRLVQRYYRPQRQAARHRVRSCDYDRYAPLFSDQPALRLADRRGKSCRSSYAAFSPAGRRRSFESSSTSDWIDAELRPGKRGGAFSSSAVPSVHPYILMNFTDKLRDVMTLAHELGHGLHQYLSRGVGYLAVRHAA